MLREEHRLKAFENRVLKKIFWSKRDKVAVNWRRLYNEQLSDQYPSPSVIQVIKPRRMRRRTYGSYGREESSLQGFGVKT
jgi:hypothetical protein